MMTRTLRFVGRLWCAFFGALITFGLVGVLRKDGFKAAAKTLDPFDAHGMNGAVMLLMFAPGLLAWYVADRLQLPQALTIDNALKIVRAYRSLLETSEGRSVSVAELPAPKHKVKEALRIVAGVSHDARDMSALGDAYISLANVRELSSSPRRDHETAAVAEAAMLAREWQQIARDAAARFAGRVTESTRGASPNER